MYARNKRNGNVGDVIAEYDHAVDVTLHRSQNRVRWKLGSGSVEFIEFGSFNPKEPNYVKGGKIVKVR